MINKICEGCVGMNEAVTCFVKIDFEEYSDCPCGNCIVKVLCGSYCQERISYYCGRRVKEVKEETELTLRR